ncbi:hypothetical protein GWK47_004401 [Chionoecetes opilio]|uniref:Uncharacterized protein n=1 Tax=Chionoecetes opilio TaxID=41210 RepID=A0A8J4YM09_CHIOP|nr:hypothetical protein GWK47_004401 [Chionoecetes opilio]
MSEHSCWGRSTMVVMMVMVMVMMTVGGVMGSPQTRRENSKDPVFNIWEFAISNRNYNPKRETTTAKDPCTWAIVKCCLLLTRSKQDECFDTNGCPGAWFNNLCSNRFKGLARNVLQSSFDGGF